MYNKLYVLILIYMRARRRKVVQVVFCGCGSGWNKRWICLLVWYLLGRAYNTVR